MKTTSAIFAFAAAAAAQQVTQISDGQVQAATSAMSSAATSYACNPAHQYPEGQVCTEMNGSLTLIMTTGPAASGGAAPATYGSASAAATGAVVSQIGDGQPQAPVSGSASMMSSASATGAIVSQISDGQPQAPVSSMMGSATATGYSSPSVSVTPYTGAAGKVVAGGVAVLGGVVAVLLL